MLQLSHGRVLVLLVGRPMKVEKSKGVFKFRAETFR